VIYVSAHDMLTQLRSARADATHDRKTLRFTTPDVLIVDDLGLRPLVTDEPIDLYEIIRQRCEHGSTIFTSNARTGVGHPCSVACCWRAPRSTGCFITLT
jgi:DNA replication protein DnaC